jgi:hypothetical protein
VEGFARLYDSEITSIVNGIIPMLTVRFMRCPSGPWFDNHCRMAKRNIRHLEREVRRAAAADITAATASWTARRREYRYLLRRKREALWKAKIDTERSTT